MESSELPCKEVVAVVTEYLEQTLLSEMQAAVDAHLTECPGCMTYYEQVRQTIALLQQRAQEPRLPGTREELLQKFRQRLEMSRDDPDSCTRGYQGHTSADLSAAGESRSAQTAAPLAAPGLAQHRGMGER